MWNLLSLFDLSSMIFSILLENERENQAQYSEDEKKKYIECDILA